ncbi:MAG: 3-deoxy-manno-octulosonate cytidylyltransferase [Pseudomonadota bacterium]
MKSIILIPARMAATRLPDKPLALIGGEPMIVHVWRRAMEADIGPVAIACDDIRIADAIRAAGGQAVMTRDDHASGSDRIFEAVERLDPNRAISCVVNVQGDLPTVSKETIRACVAMLDDSNVAIGTPCAEITRDEERTEPHVVKVVGTPLSPSRLRTLYFTRATAPHGPGPLYHHIGLYAYRRAALDSFVALPPSPLETREKLEQLRALEAGMRIDAAIVDTVPFGVDTPADLERAQTLVAALSPSSSSTPSDLS